jgi:hypothetical protein
VRQRLREEEERQRQRAGDDGEGADKRLEAMSAQLLKKQVHFHRYFFKFDDHLCHHSTPHRSSWTIWFVRRAPSLLVFARQCNERSNWSSKRSNGQSGAKKRMWRRAGPREACANARHRRWCKEAVAPSHAFRPSPSTNTSRKLLTQWTNGGVLFLACLTECPCSFLFAQVPLGGPLPSQQRLCATLLPPLRVRFPVTITCVLVAHELSLVPRAAG